jgi:hypothetical protein
VTNRLSYGTAMSIIISLNLSLLLPTKNIIAKGHQNNYFADFELNLVSQELSYSHPIWQK